MDGYCICICVSDQGITTSVEAMDEPTENGQPAQSIDEALQQAKALYDERNGEAGAQAQFNQGFADTTDTGRGGAVGPAERFA